MTQGRAIVIGAGLCGLTAAWKLVDLGHHVTVLEARDRVGGRALSLQSKNGAIDLGPAWIWPRMQPNVCALLDIFGLETLPQYESGTFVYETAQGIQHGQLPARYADAARVRGGIGTLVDALASALPADTIHKDQIVSSLDLNGTPRVQTRSGQTWDAAAVISAVPPPIAKGWNVTPRWDNDLAEAMTRWPTWMAAHAKVLAVYDTPFWRDAGFSGSAVSQVGPLVEVADQSEPDCGHFALFGFVGWPYERRQDQQDLKAASLDQLQRLFGAAAGHPKQLTIMDWASERFTATETDRAAPNGHPSYGAPELSRPVRDRLFFAGAEVSQTNGGLIEGAIETGLMAARMVSERVSR